MDGSAPICIHFFKFKMIWQLKVEKDDSVSLTFSVTHFVLLNESCIYLFLIILYKTNYLFSTNSSQIISRILHDTIVLDGFVPSTAPMTIAAMNRIIDKQIGMMNLFWQYQWRVLSLIMLPLVSLVSNE